MLRRGEVWWASLPDPAGSAPGYRRPVVVVQSNDFNASALGTVTVVTVTSNTALAAAPGNVPLRRKQSGLPRDSVANVSQLLTVDRSLLAERVGMLSGRLVERIDDGLRLALDL